MATIDMTEEIDVQDDVLAAALALIDDVYESYEQTTSKGNRGSRREERHELRAQVDELEQWLDTIRWIRAGNGVTALASAWAEVATRQRLQRGEAIGSNALLRDVVIDQRELAVQVCTTLEHARHMLISGMMPRARFFHSLPLAAPPPPILAQQLDALHQRVLAMSPIDPPLEPEETLHWTANSDTIQFHARLTGRYPFKLSAVTSEIWKMMHENSDGQVEGRLEDDESACEFLLQVHKPFGHLEIQGSNVMRRTFLPDGSVLLASVGLSTGPSSDENVMAGFETLEIVWARVMHHDRGNARSGVCIELGDELFACVPGHCGPSLDVSSRFERFQAFIQQCHDEDGSQSRQRLENRLLTSSLASRPTSPYTTP